MYCDLYASATADTRWSDSSTRAGTPNDPFHDLQSALHAALRGARVDADDSARDSPNEGSRLQGDENFVRGPKSKSVRWLNKDVIRLSPGVYRGEGNVALAMDAQLVDIVAGEPDDWPDVENVRSPGVPTATVDCREVDQVRGEFILLLVRAISVTDDDVFCAQGTETLAGLFVSSRRSACRWAGRPRGDPTAPARSWVTARWRSRVSRSNGVSTTEGSVSLSLMVRLLFNACMGNLSDDAVFCFCYRRRFVLGG